MRRFAFLLAALPLPIFSDELPMPKFTVVHVDQPIVKPAMIPHTASWGLGDQCPMCVGGHLVNYHGLTQRQLDTIGYWDWPKYHAGLHRDSTRVSGTRPAAAVTTNPNPAGQSTARTGCSGGVCRKSLRSFLFRR